VSNQVLRKTTKCSREFQFNYELQNTYIYTYVHSDKIRQRWVCGWKMAICMPRQICGWN